MSTSFEGGSEGGTDRIVDILQPAAVESPGGEQSNNLYDYGLKKLLNEFAESSSMRSTSETGAAIAMSGDTRLEGSTVVVDGDSTRPNKDLENGGVGDESTGGGVAAETFPRDYHQDNDNYKESECRICQMSSTTDVVIDLGCRCKLDLGRAHGVCAETWFRFKGNRQCEICGHIAKYAYRYNAPSKQGTNIANNGFSSESGDSEDRRSGRGSIADNSLENDSRHRNPTVTRPRTVPTNLVNVTRRHDTSIDESGDSCPYANGKGGIFMVYGVIAVVIFFHFYIRDEAPELLNTTIRVDHACQGVRMRARQAVGLVCKEGT